MSALAQVARGNSRNVKWIIRQLTESWSIYDVKRLLYEVYIKEMGWKFAVNNPTGFEISKSPFGKNILTDNLDSHSSWFGAYDNERLVAVLRLVYRDKNDHLDLTRYDSSKKPKFGPILDKALNPNLVELQRCAVHSCYRQTDVFPHILHHTVNYAFEKGFDIIGTTSVPRLVTFFQQNCKVKVIEREFYYSENQHGPSTVFYAPHNDLLNVRRQLDKVISQYCRVITAKEIRSQRRLRMEQEL